MRSWTKRDAKMAEFGHAILVVFFMVKRTFFFEGKTSVIE